jgi:hypothetical protein
MKPSSLLMWLCASALLAGCLEVEQHPPFMNGAYNGKPDQLAWQREFHDSKLAWNAAISNRNHQQNEYLRSP